MQNISKRVLCFNPIKYSFRNFSAKIFKSSQEAISDISPGSRLLVGGFGICGIPENLIRAIASRDDLRNLIVYSNNCGIKDWGLAILVKQNKIKRMCLSFFGGNEDLEKRFLKGEIEVEIIPQGSLAEKLRAGGSGIPAFFTRTGFGTTVEKGGIPILFSKNGKTVLIQSDAKEIRKIKGREYIYEESINGDFALIKGWKADTKGNIIFRKTARNLNPDCAKAAKITIAEVEEIVPAGVLNPDEIHLPGVFVDRLVKGEYFEKPIERLIFDRPDFNINNIVKDSDASCKEFKREKIARRAAKEILPGMYVNLGIGIPTLISRYIPDSIDVQIHSENGMLGTGKYPQSSNDVDPDIINASKESVLETPGCSYFSSSESFSIVRGNRLGLTILGGMQVDEKADLANWIIPNKLVTGMGGAMDLVSSSNTKVLVCMEHTTKNGQSKILKQCKLPITGLGCIWKIITDLGVFEFVQDKSLVLQEIFEDTTLDEVMKYTDAEFKIASNLKSIKI